MQPSTSGKALDLRPALKRVDAFAEQQMQIDRTPGLALALTDRQRTIAVRAYGYADLGTSSPLTGDTLFEIGSIGKSFTAILCMQLAEEGLLDLHAPLRSYLPWFQVGSEDDPVTLHHLLSHTAGIVNGMDFTGEPRFEVLALNETAASPPGKIFHYSNAGYKALGVLLEDLLEKPYAELVAGRVLEPLGMSASRGSITNAVRPQMAAGYQPYYDDRPDHPSRPVAPAPWLETNTADGCLVSTAEDMTDYLRVWLNGGHRGVLSESGFQRMTEPVIAAYDEHQYCYGLILSEFDGFRHLAHGGGMVGYLSMMLNDIDNGYGAIVLANGPADTLATAQFALKCLRGLHLEGELPSLPPLPNPAHIQDPQRYAGVYRAGERRLTLQADRERLILDYEGQRLALEQRAPDRFFVPHADFERFLLGFEFSESGEAAAALHGAARYANEAYEGAEETPAGDPDWAAFTGHYRSHNPWYSNFRVVQRAGELLLIWPSGREEPLTPLDDRSFRVGEDPLSPERVRFDTQMNEKALRANLSGGDFYRTFTP